jgi:pyrroloquinoline quinone biosynthesis protein D
MNLAAIPRFGKGVKLRRDPDGTVMLLVPEAALLLNPVAAAALEQIDGERSLDQIVETIVVEFEVTRERAAADVSALFDRLAQRGFVR